MSKRLKDEVQEPGAKRLSDKYYEPGEITWDLRPGWNDLPHIDDDGGDEREPNIPWWQNSPIYNETPYDGIDDPDDVAWDTYTPSPTDYSKRFSPSQEYFDLIKRMGGSPDGGTNGNKGDKDDDGKTPNDQGNTDITPAMAYLQQMQGMIDGIDLDKFKFDLNGEELYQQYRDQYLRNGRLAMMDTMGQAAGLTGGYGSSYAQNAGQQAYQGYVNELNAVVPQVYDRAYQRWGDEQDLKLRKYQLMGDMADRLIAQDERDYTRQYDADKLEAEKQKNEYDYNVKMAELEDKADTRDLNWQKYYLDMANKGFAYDENGNLVKVKEPEAITIHGVSADEISEKVYNYFDNISVEGAVGFNNAVQALQGVATNKGKDVAGVIADILAEENKWDAMQRAEALKTIKYLLSE